MKQNKVALTGYSIANGEEGMSFKIPRYLDRFASRSVKCGIIASQRAFEMAEVDPNSLQEDFGFYTSQSGFQHSDIDDLGPHLGQKSLLKSVYRSANFDPFLIVKSLSNNLLGVISAYWRLRGDCTAFVRDGSGIKSALNEAVFNLKHGYCHQVLVLSAGTEKDILDNVFEGSDNPEKQHIGAVAFFLETEQLANAKNKKIITYLSDQPSSDQSILNINKEIVGEQPRWGGLMTALLDELILIQKIT